MIVDDAGDKTMDAASKLESIFVLLKYRIKFLSFLTTRDFQSEHQNRKPPQHSLIIR